MNKKKQLTLYVDTRRCMGCRACEIACKLENSLPRGPRYTMVTETEVIEDGVDKLKFLPVPCQHCADAPCLKACPTGAIYKREDGIVLVNKKSALAAMSACGAAPSACPSTVQTAECRSAPCAHSVRITARSLPAQRLALQRQFWWAPLRKFPPRCAAVTAQSLPTVRLTSA